MATLVVPPRSLKGTKRTPSDPRRPQDPPRTAQRLVDRDGNFTQNITPNTALLVVEQQDREKLVCHKISSKMRKAATMAADGHHITIVDETDFISLFAT